MVRAPFVRSRRTPPVASHTSSRVSRRRLRSAGFFVGASSKCSRTRCLWENLHSPARRFYFASGTETSADLAAPSDQNGTRRSYGISALGRRQLGGILERAGLRKQSRELPVRLLGFADKLFAGVRESSPYETEDFFPMRRTAGTPPSATELHSHFISPARLVFTLFLAVHRTSLQSWSVEPANRSLEFADGV